MEGKTGYEILDSYFSAIIKKAKEEYRNKGIKPELVYEKKGVCYLFKYDIGGLHLYYDNMKDNCYISKEDLFVDKTKRNGVVYLEKYLKDGDNKSGRYILKCIDTTDSGTDRDTFQINYVNGLPNIKDSMYLPPVDFKPGVQGSKYDIQNIELLNPYIEEVLKVAIQNTAPNGTRIKTKYQEALELIQEMRKIAEKEINKSKGEEPER